VLLLDTVLPLDAVLPLDTAPLMLRPLDF
jgi:hypothetical protein